jgi:hypothetical protein
MRFVFALASIASLSGVAQAQFEGWEPGPGTPGVAAIPAAWTSVNASVGGPGTNPNWQVRNDGVVFPALTGNTYAFANYNSSTGANDISNYLMSPQVTISNGAQISFWTRTITAPTFADRLELVFNTTGSTNPVDFTNVLVTVNPTLTPAGYPTTWTQFTATITGVTGTPTGRYAFHYNPTNGGPLGSNSDYVGIDDVLFIPAGGGTLATNTTIGQGCYNRSNSFYELFPAGGNDLSNTSWILTQNGSGGYDVTPGGAPYSLASGTATVVTLGDDTSSSVGTLGLEVGSNGWVATGPGNNTGYTPDVPTFLNDPSSVIRFWHDMNPASAGSGQVFYEETGVTAVINFDGVYDFAGPSPSSIRVEMLVAAPGVVPIIQIAFGTLSTGGNAWLVGYSAGGPSNDPGSIDLSATTLVSTSDPETLPLTLTASTRPVLGTNWDLAVSNSALLDLIILGTTDPNISDLFFIGMPGCGLRASLDLIVTGSTVSLAVPNTTSLSGASLFANAASIAPGANAFGFISSNGIQGLIGDF